MHGTRVSAGKEKGHATALFLVHEIALNAYSNSTFFGRTYRELKRAGSISERKPSPSNLEGLTR